MVPGPDIYGGFMLLTVLPTVYLINLFWEYRDRPGGRWLILTLVGMGGWGGSWGLMLLFGTYLPSLVSFYAVILFVNVAAVSWLFVAIEYVWQTRIGARTIAPFLVIPTVIQLLVWTNSLHNLVLGPETTMDGSVLLPQYEVGFYFHALHAYLLVIVSTVLLAIAFFDREGPYRKQAFLLFIGILIPVSTATVFLFDVMPAYYLNPTPIAFLVGASIWGWGLFRYRLLKTVPVARRRVLSEMDEGLLIVDGQGVVTNANPALRDILGLEDDPAGDNIEAVLSRRPELLTLLDDEFGEHKISLDVDGRQRHLTVRQLPVTQSGTSAGQIIVFNDQTELLRYEEELELLKEVLSRVLRHDIRNKLNVIRSHGELLVQQTTDAQQQSARKVVQTADQIIGTAEKARAIGSLVESNRERYDIDLVRVVEDTADWGRDTFPDATVDVGTVDGVPIEINETVAAADRVLSTGMVEPHQYAGF
ncbi:MAG: histidine kinase N-terminal 7TM domain-containing protein, partial [Bradymonadaceae bacterium]